MTDVLDIRQLVVVVTLALAGVAGCAPPCVNVMQASVRAPDSRPQPAFDPAAPLCDAYLARDAPAASPCRLIGVYALNTYPNKDGGVRDAWPTVFREGVGWVMLESIWYPEKRPSAETSARYEGKWVEVYGVPHPVPPAAGSENYRYAPCISPVYEIRVLDGEPE
ncbi:MAG: hypothetical protein H6711_15440 [Myxococcales bacterium]|nr:hypothetical protein [Myxococcales bacterium]